MPILLPQRRLSFLLVLLGVVGAHAWLGRHWPDTRLGAGAAEAALRRIDVAFVRELAPAAPPATGPVAPPPRPPARATAARPAMAASAASAPEQPAPRAVEPDATPALPLAAAEAEPNARGEATPARPPEPATAAASQPLPGEPPPLPVTAAASAPQAAQFEWPPSTRLSYSLSGYYQGEVLGQAQVEWLRQGVRYQVHLDVSVGPAFAPLLSRRMSSEGELGPEGLHPRLYQEETRQLLREPRRRSIRFEPTRVLLPGNKVREPWAGMQDSASQFVQLSYLFTLRPELLRAGQTLEVPLALPSNTDRWVYEVLGQEELATPLGPINTFHVRPRRETRPGGDLVAEMWFAPSLQYLPVRIKIRQDAQTFVDLQLERPPQQAGP